MSEESTTFFMIPFTYNYRRAFPEFDSRLIQAVQQTPVEGGWSQICDRRYLHWRIAGQLEAEALVRCVAEFMQAHGFQRAEARHPMELLHAHPDQQEFFVGALPVGVATRDTDHPEHPSHHVNEEAVSASVKETLERIQRTQKH